MLNSNSSSPNRRNTVLAAVNKGDFNAECNRTACDNPEAVYYNHSTRKHYCYSCAMQINQANRADALRLFGHDLCTLSNGG